MRRLLILAFSILLLIGACKNSKEVYLFTSFKEPANEGLRMLFSYDGYHWQRFDTIFLAPEVGKQKVMRDPSIVQGPDGIFHLVWTSSWRGDLGFGYSNSKDLLNWSEQRFITVMDFDTSTVNVWAPELFYEVETETFYILWASTIPYKFEKGVEEERNNHRMYYTTTKDFKTFADTRLFIDPGFSIIDAIIVKRNPKDYVLVLKDNTRPERNLKVAFGEGPAGPFQNISEPFTKSFTEGPSEVKIGDEYLIYCDAYRDKTYKAVRTKDFKTFTDITNEVSVPVDHKHGTIFKVKETFLNTLLEKVKVED
jgi:hypothetical protein